MDFFDVLFPIFSGSVVVQTRVLTLLGTQMTFPSDRNLGTVLSKPLLGFYGSGTEGRGH